MADDRLASSLQLLVMTTLCFDAPYGALIASQVKPEYFDSVYRDFVTRVLRYRKQHSKPPGRSLLNDIADQTAFGRGNTLIRKRLIPELVAGSEGLNAGYVAGRVQEFIRSQVMKTTLV